MELINKLNWRYATKAMNRQVVPQGKIDNIIEAISLAPTSSGLQPFEVIVITNQEIKDQIKPIAWGQSVVSDCSHLLVFAAWDNYTEDRINGMFDLVNEVRGMKNEGWENYQTNALEKLSPTRSRNQFQSRRKTSLHRFWTSDCSRSFRRS